MQNRLDAVVFAFGVIMIRRAASTAARVARENRRDPESFGHESPIIYHSSFSDYQIRKNILIALFCQ
jgi:hypothetical protein